MTNPGPWTESGQAETKKSRTWWIVGGAVLAVVVVAVAYLAGRGWDAATQEESANPAATTASAPPAAPSGPTEEASAEELIMADGVGGRDPVALSERISDLAGVRLTHVVVDDLATSTCDALDAGATNRQVADEAAASTAGHWSDTQARMVALMMMLEYCPRHAQTN